MTVEAVEEGQRSPLAARLALNADGILEQIARDYGVSTLEVVRNLLPEHRAVVEAKLFADIMQDVTTWGDILFIVHTPDIVLECAGPLPPGTFGPGYYNVHGDGPISAPRTARPSPSCRARSWVGPHARSSSSTAQARRCSRSSSAATRRAN
jgi:putative heme iron utilization protein